MKSLFLKLAWVAGCVLVYCIGCAAINVCIADSVVLYVIWAIVMAKMFKKVKEELD